MSKPKKMRVSNHRNAGWRPYTPERIHPRAFQRTKSQHALMEYWVMKIAAGEREWAVRLLQEHSLLLTGKTELERGPALGWIGRFKAYAEKLSIRAA